MNYFVETKTKKEASELFRVVNKHKLVLLKYKKLFIDFWDKNKSESVYQIYSISVKNFGYGSREYFSNCGVVIYFMSVKQFTKMKKERRFYRSNINMYINEIKV